MPDMQYKCTTVGRIAFTNHTTMPLLVKPPTGKPFEITLQTSETVDVLKACIQEVEGIPVTFTSEFLITHSNHIELL
jgi:hypothetical protein